jgi:predicted CXXCH cytochrome family protein
VWLRRAGGMIVRRIVTLFPPLSRGVAFVLMATAGLVLARAQVPSSHPASPHPGSQVTIEPHAKCSSCHVSEGLPEEDLMHVGNRTVRKCTSCHTGYLDPSGSGEGAARWGHVTGRQYNEIPLGEDLSEEPAEDLSEQHVEELQCLSCHEHHPNDRPNQLRVAVGADGEPDLSLSHLDPISQSCMCCHHEAAKFKLGQKHLRHPVGIQATIRRQREEPLPLVDVHGTADARDDVIACTTCHYAHTGPNPDILRWNPEEQGEACTVCHDKGPRRGAV